MRWFPFESARGAASAVLGLLDRFPGGEPARQRVPVRHAALPALPAQEDDAIALERVEIDEALVEILDHASLGMDGGHRLRDLLAQVLGPSLARLEGGQVGVRRRRTGL